LVVGNGQNGTNRSNAMVIRKSGNTGIGVDFPTHLLELGQDDAAKPGTNTWTIASDRRLKQDIRAYDDGIGTVLAIEPVRYRYNGKGGIKATEREYVGVVAQDLQRVAPYMIRQHTYHNPETGRDEEYLAVNNSAMTYTLVNAVKEQQAQIEQLRAEKEALQQQMASMKANYGQRLQRLEAMLGAQADAR